MNYRVSDSVAWQVINGEVMIVNLASGEALGLNATASDIWRQIAEGAEEVCDAFAAKYGLEPDRARADIDAFIRQMVNEGLLESRV